MRSLLNRLRDDRGAVAVVMAPVVMFVIVPMLAITVDSGNLFISRSAQQNAADQAAKAAAWAGCNSRDATAAATASATRNGFTAAGKTSLGTVAAVTVTNRGSGAWGVTIDVDVKGVFSPAVGVQTMRVSARAGATCTQTTAPGGALYAHGSCNNSMQFTGNSIDITGGMHTNGQLNIVGNDIDVKGAATYGTTQSVVGNGITFTPSAPAKVAARSWPLQFTIADFDNSPAGQYSSRSDYVSAGSADIDNSWLYSRGYLTGLGGGTLTSKIYYTDGDINLTGNSITGTATFVARGDISFTGNTVTIAPKFMNLNAFSSKGTPSCSTDAVRLVGNYLNLTGILYAPNGRIPLTGNYVTVDGAIVAYAIQITANNKTVKAGPGSSVQEDPFVTLDVW